MGGPVPLGYDVDNRRLVVNDKDADVVRHIMQRYLALGTAVELGEELNRQGYLAKVQQRTIAAGDLATASLRSGSAHAKAAWLETIVEGRQSVPLNSRTLLAIDLPLSWAEQRTTLGFA